MPLVVILALMVGATLSYLVTTNLKANDNIKITPLTEYSFFEEQDVNRIIMDNIL